VIPPISARARIAQAAVTELRRNAEVSGDFSAHHLDLEVARLSGFDEVFLHGLCTMALCARAGVRTVAQGDPRRFRRLVVQFAKPALLDRDLTVRLFSIDDRRIAFEDTSDDAPVIRNGIVALRRAS